MRHAPTVTYPTDRSTTLARALGLLALLGAVPWVWMLFEALALQESAQTAIISVAICVFLWLAACLALAQFWRRQRARTLRWDGADWWLGAPGQLSQALPAGLPGDQCVCAACAQRLLQANTGVPSVT